MTQLHLENHGVGLFGVAMFLHIRSRVSAASNTWTEVETVRHVKMNQFQENKHLKYSMGICEEVDSGYLVKQISASLHLNYEIT